MLQYVGSNSLKSNVVKPILNKSDNQEYYLVDGITVAQGPNYALAKRMQHWRCIVCFLSFFFILFYFFFFEGRQRFSVKNECSERG